MPNVRKVPLEDVLAFIREYTTKHTYPPTRREIMRGIGVKSPATAQRYVDELEEAGEIIVFPGLARGMLIGKGLEA